MVYGSEWTGTLVLERLVAFFAADTGVSLRAETGDLFPIDPSAPIDGLDIVRAVLKVLGPRSPASKMLLARARASAKGMSVAELCREAGWAPSTVNRVVAAGCAHVSAMLNWRHCHLLPEHRDGGELPPDRLPTPHASGISQE